MAPKAKGEAKSKAKAKAKAAARNDDVEETQQQEEQNMKSKMTQMVAECSGANATQAQKEMLAEYKALGLRDANKRALCTKYFGDKSAGWFPTWKENFTKSKVQTQTCESGWLPAFMVAEKLGLKEDSPVFEAILSELPCQDASEWSDNVPLERGFKKAGLKRYGYSNSLLGQESETSTRSQHIESGMIGKKQKGGGSLDDLMDAATSVAQEETTVQIEAEKHRIMMFECNVVESALPKIASMMKACKVLCANLAHLAKGDKEAHEKRKEEVASFVSELDNFENDTLSVKAMCECIERTDEQQCEEVAKHLVKMKEIGTGLLEEGKTLQSKQKSYMESL